MQLSVNENLFFIVRDGAIIVWNYKNHDQFELSLPYFHKIIEVETKSINYVIDMEKQDLILSNLIDGNIIIKDQLNKSDWRYDILSKIFHVGTSDIIQIHNTDSPLEAEIDYLKYCTSISSKEKPYTEKNFIGKVKLNTSENSLFKICDFKTCLKQRKSVRVFNDEKLSVDILSELLYYSFGYIHDEEKEVGIGPRKSSPSGGNLHPTEAYIVTKGVDNLSDSLYYYDPNDHSLNSVRDNVTVNWLPKALLGQYFSLNANIHIFLTFRFDLGAWKYPHSRGYRAALLDVGHVSQTFQLVSTALGLNTWITGAFEDSTINDFLNIDGEKEATLFYLSAGSSNGQRDPQEFQLLANLG